jgi:DNA-binding transcriptional ArsR family regulator
MILRALNHKLRQQIIRILDENKRLTVTELYVQLRLEQSVASQHLAILRRAGIVKTERDGKFIYYTVNNNRISDIMKSVDELIS